MKQLLGFIICYFSIILGSIFISKIFNKKIEGCIIIDIFIKMILLYIFGLFDKLLLCVWIVNILPIILGTITIIANLKNKQLKENILTPGILFFTIAYFLFIIFTNGMMMYYWDEYSYWSIASKKMFYTNNLINYGMVTTYPPVPTILQYYFTKTLNTYSQGTELFANIILGFSLLLPLYEKIKTKKILPNLLFGICIICIPEILSYMLFYQTIYTDAILGLIIGYIFYQYYNEKNKKFNVFSLTLGLIILSLTKSMGMYICALLILLGIVKSIVETVIENKQKKISITNYIKDNYKKIIIFLLIIASVLLMIISYKIKYNENASQTTTYNKLLQEYIQINNGERKTNFEKIKEVIYSIKGTVLYSTDKTKAKDEIISNFFIALCRDKVFTRPINVSIFSFLMLYIIASILMYKKIYKDEKQKKEFLITNTIIYIGLIIYILLLLMAYLTQFGEGEAYKFPSFDRYVNSYVLGILVFILSIALEKFNDNDNKKITAKFVMLTCVILLFTPIYEITPYTITSGYTKAVRTSELRELISESEKIKKTLKENERIALINQNGGTTPTSFQLKYFLYPEIEIDKALPISSTYEETFGDEYLNKIIDCLYEQYDYVYVYETNDYLYNLAKEIFENETIEEKTLYKIDKISENNIKLIPVQ